jgi:hypothetical protein
MEMLQRRWTAPREDPSPSRDDALPLATMKILCGRRKSSSGDGSSSREDPPSSRDDALPPAATEILRGRWKCSSGDGSSSREDPPSSRDDTLPPAAMEILRGRRRCSSGDGPAPREDPPSSRDDALPPAAMEMLRGRRSVVSGEKPAVRGEKPPTREMKRRRATRNPVPFSSSGIGGGREESRGSGGDSVALREVGAMAEDGGAGPFFTIPNRPQGRLPICGFRGERPALRITGLWLSAPLPQNVLHCRSVSQGLQSENQQILGPPLAGSVISF